MATKIHCKSYLPGFYSMRELNEGSSSSSWPLFYGDKTLLPNGQYYNGFMPRGFVDGYPGHDKDALKQKMLEHEAVFKNQVYELHRLYGIQRDMMQEVKRNETNKHRASMEPASSSSLHGSQVPLDEAQKWHMAGFPLLNSSYSRTSISGVEIVNSPMTCIKTNTTQPGYLPFQNGSTSKDSVGPRPFKVRKKLFDLRLPADEYLDIQEGENLEYKESDISGYAPNCNPNGGPEGSTKLFLDGHGLKGSNGLADLNEPIQIEEAMAPSSVEFLGHTGNVETKVVDKLSKSNAGYLGVTGESVRVTNGFPVNSSIGSKVNTRGRLSHICEAGSTRGNLYSATQGPEQDNLHFPSHPMQDMLNQVHHPLGTFPNGYYCREDMWRDGPRHGLESSDRNRDPFVGSSSFATSWAQSVSSWAKPTSSFAQNVTTLETCPKPSFFGRNESTLNGVHQTSASGSKEVHIHSTNHGFGILSKGSCDADSKPGIDINLNEAISDEIVIPQDLNGESKPEDHLSVLPWLKPKPVKDSNIKLASNNSENESKDEIAETRPIKKILGIPIFEKVCVAENEPSPLASASASFDCCPEEKNVTDKRKNISIDINVACEPDEQIASDEPTSKKEKPINGTVIRDHVIDLNSCVSDCDDPPAPNYERKTASVKITLEIDLEVPVFLESEDDGSTLSKENIQGEEHLQLSQNKNEPIKDDEVLRNAAETIFDISSLGPQTTSRPSEASLAEALLWFVNAVSSCTDESSRAKKDCSSEEIDDFEVMTLKLTETKEEDYMPKPFVLDIPKIEEEKGANSSQTRSRRGQSRRGRQRRDFQRDILPGLTTLSRHEVTEDLQIFGGLMKAMGHSWSSVLTRRNGGGRGRGRRRTVVVEKNVIGSSVCAPLVKRVNNSHVEGGLEDRCLTGWGKTTRRPRRQRCPAGNISTIVFT